ncbi:GGDEF domain-containing phosphodiesterase [Clostridium nigeriense]|uniref:sensor domain-containing protein n=1 Tax=Clostridium nigeriense TaxID=1805470 RepID=UPI001F373173|nr:GGDEF domain-containing phosphodiesterase [Clostridium nigeriense]
MKRKYDKTNLLFFIPVLGVLLISSKLDIFTTALILMLIIILMLTINLAYKNKKYKKLYNQAESNKRRYRMAIEALDGAIWEWSSEKNKLFISKKIKDLLKINNDITSFEEWLSFVLEEEREDIRIFIENTIENRILDNFVLEHTVIDSEEKRLTIKFRGKGSIKEEIFYLSGVITDFTERRRLENINKAREDKNRLALEGSKDIVYWWNVKENIMSVGSSIRKYLNIQGSGDLLIPASTWETYIMKEDLDSYKYKIEKVIKSNKNEFYTIEYRILGKDNKAYWIESKGKKTIEKNGDIFIHGALSDITIRKEKEIEINYLSFNDEVTGIPNRRYFVREISSMIKEYPNEKFALIFIDIDNFKYVNDTYGHDTGDALLTEFTKIILGMNIKDSLLARYGGDEFILVKNKLKGKNQIKDLLDNIIKKLSKPIVVNNKEIFCTLSIGVSIYPIDGKEIGILLKRSDMAMYLAKFNGKNRYEFFDLRILEILNREFDIEKGLRTAIDNEEIKLVFQPKILIDSGTVIGFESLVRWNSKDLGFVPPNEFIPIAENSGLIIPIGRYIINESFKKCKELSLMTNRKFKMAINLSEVQIRDEEIVDYVAETLERYELDASYIEFEITESIIMKSAEKNIKTLEKLKALGVTLALDDFGTGYSSLSYLRTLPIDVLKIDKSFIDGILIEEKSEYIINSIIDLSHYLNLLVVAEGVETKEQLDYLKRSSCDIIQGYYFSKPIQFDEASKMIINS